MIPQLSVILPVFNRTALLAHPLESLRAAQGAGKLGWELIVVDDGSTEDVASILAGYADLPIKLHRLPENRGLLAARLAGLAHAQGDAVFFLDADDAIAAGKFSTQLPALAGADVVYGDTARRSLDETGRPSGPLRVDGRQRSVSGPAEFYLEVQPAPHNPIFRRSYLQAVVSAPLFPPLRVFDSIAETWFYYQLSVTPAKIAYCPGAWSIVGEPAGERLSRKWERQAAAALQLMRAFFRHCPISVETHEARRRVGLCAFATWRALPCGFPPADAFLALWRHAPASSAIALGGRKFARAAQFLGPVTAGRLFKFCLRPRYETIRTVEPEELSRLFAS